MLISEYYSILGLPLDSSLEEIKKAYRKKARLYHPDINRSPEAKEKFIEATEAYDFLITNHGKGQLDDQDYFKIVEEWRKYRQDRSRQRAQYYARSSFNQFKNSKYYTILKLLEDESTFATRETPLLEAGLLPRRYGRSAVPLLNLLRVSRGAR